MDELRRTFLAEARDSLIDVEQACAALARQAEAPDAPLRRALRQLHSLRGTCGFFGLAALEAATREVEALLCAVRDRRRRADRATLDSVLDGIGRIHACLPDPPAPESGAAPAPRAPLHDICRLLPALVRDLAGRLDKVIELRVTGSEIELDRRALDTLRAPLIQLVRNATDHSLEGAEERCRFGKPETGMLQLAIHREPGQVVLTLSDDGRGLQIAKVRRRIVELGLISMTEAAALSEAEVLDYLFRPGFSTAPAAGAVSGHGIGLDLARAALAEIGGTIALASVPGAGSRVVLTVPDDAQGVIRHTGPEVAGERRPRLPGLQGAAVPA